MNKDIAEIIEDERAGANKELIIVSAICTFVGILIGFFLGKQTASKNTLKKFNKCYSYDFGDEEAEEE